MTGDALRPRVESTPGYAFDAGDESRSRIGTDDGADASSGSGRHEGPIPPIDQGASPVTLCRSPSTSDQPNDRSENDAGSVVDDSADEGESTDEEESADKEGSADGVESVSGSERDTGPTSSAERESTEDESDGRSQALEFARLARAIAETMLALLRLIKYL